MVNNLREWPADEVSIGTEGDRVFFILPQGSGRARLYLMYAPDQRRRYAGSASARAFLDSFALDCVPGSENIVRADAAGPCATYPMNDSWTDSPLADGVVLIGDAAGYSDPHLGQGLSLALRDVREVSELLLADDNWAVSHLAPYAESHAERMRRLRISAQLLTTLRGEFGPEARERRRHARARIQTEPDLGLWRRATLVGPDALPAEAFDASVCERLFASAAAKV
ncbi:MAG: FAD-dependent monooxygenase [Chloroflexi bacterium]|nr:FAD-dependent monooxygenase [Chloroflexota bacterium]